MQAPRFDAVASDPLSDQVLSYLFNQKYETPSIDFKETIDTSRGSDFAKIARHFFAMSNYGGGFLMVGFRSKPTGGYDSVGLPSTFHIDQAEVQGKFNGLSSIPLEIGYREIDRVVGDTIRRFAVIYIPPAPDVIVPVAEVRYKTERGKEKLAFAKGETLIRRGTSTSRAAPHEVEWIRNRARNTSYRIALLSGQPDAIDETIVANVFPALSLPQNVFTCVIELRGRPIPPHTLSSCLVQDHVLYSFENPVQTPLSSVIKRGSGSSGLVSEWRKDPDRSRIIAQLLDSAIVLKGKAIGLSYDESRRRFFYPLEEDTDKREESWPGISRKDTRQVAVYRHLPLLGRKVGIHHSVRVDFLWLGDKVYLRMEPGFLLTEDGRRPLHGPAQGRVLTSLESWLSSLNGGYLRSVLYWGSVFVSGLDRMKLAPGLDFDRRPLETKVPVGIREDTMRALESHKHSEATAESQGGADA